METLLCLSADGYVAEWTKAQCSDSVAYGWNPNFSRVYDSINGIQLENVYSMDSRSTTTQKNDCSNMHKMHVIWYRSLKLLDFTVLFEELESSDHATGDCCAFFSISCITSSPEIYIYAHTWFFAITWYTFFIHTDLSGWFCLVWVEIINDGSNSTSADWKPPSLSFFIALRRCKVKLQRCILRLPALSLSLAKNKSL